MLFRYWSSFIASLEEIDWCKIFTLCVSIFIFYSKLQLLVRSATSKTRCYGSKLSDCLYYFHIVHLYRLLFLDSHVVYRYSVRLHLQITAFFICTSHNCPCGFCSCWYIPSCLLIYLTDIFQNGFNSISFCLQLQTHRLNTNISSPPHPLPEKSLPRSLSLLPHLPLPLSPPLSPHL